MATVSVMLIALDGHRSKIMFTTTNAIDAIIERCRLSLGIKYQGSKRYRAEPLFEAEVVGKMPRFVGRTAAATSGIALL